MSTVSIVGLSLVIFANMPIRMSLRPRVLFANVGGILLLTGFLIPGTF